MPDLRTIMLNARKAGVVVPAFNIPYLPMLEPVIRAVVDLNSFALIETARLEWIKFEARGLKEVADEFDRLQDPLHVRLHLDHIPVIDEDSQRVDFLSIIQQAITLGYHSVMVDGSRLPLNENIEATSQVAELAHKAGIPLEAELGAILGHEAGPLPPYDELFTSGRGFTRVDEARRFATETNCDWLSVAIGNVHGAVSAGLKDQKKITARLDLDHLAQLSMATRIPLVLHGGSGIPREYILGAIQHGIAKINIGTEIRQAYETTLQSTSDLVQAQQAVYARTTWLLDDFFGLRDTQPRLMQEAAWIS